eukprot:4598632-Ditylum_brightwellii.AAC.1
MEMSKGRQKLQDPILDDCCSSVKIIDLGYVVPQSLLETLDTGEIVNDGIPALAEVIRLLFS